MSTARALSKTFTLSRPIPGDDGKPVTKITVQEPELRHFMAASRKPKRTEQTIALLSVLSGLPEPMIRRLKSKDALVIQRWFKSLPAEEAGHQLRVDDEGSRTFMLSAPLIVGGKPQEEITLREPDLEASAAVEPFIGDEYALQAALIAELSGLTIPVVSALKMRDADAIEAWYVPQIGGVPDPGAKLPDDAQRVGALAPADQVAAV